MEGPSLVIACEELRPFLRKVLTEITGSVTVAWPEETVEKMRGQRLVSVKSWGKHLLIKIGKAQLRIHFLMFGSYRIDDPRPNRTPKLVLSFSRSKIYFYSCAIGLLEKPLNELYDWTVDTMSSQFGAERALMKLKELPQKMVCDVLMDQTIFAGVGNIIKNEVLYRLKIHPEQKIGNLTLRHQRNLIRETLKYCHQFYIWKRANVLKRHWLIFRKKVCPVHLTKVKKRPTGSLNRISHYCSKCQIRSS